MSGIRHRQDYCPFCGHAWTRHDPEDGQCDAYTDLEPGDFGPCRCGRDLAWMQTKIAARSKDALAASAPGTEEQ